MAKTKKDSTVKSTVLEETVNVKKEMGTNAIILDLTQDKPVELITAEKKQELGMELNVNDKLWLKSTKVSLFTKAKNFVKNIFKK